MTVLEESPELWIAYRAGRAAALASVYKSYVSDVARAVRFGFLGSVGRIPGIRSPETERELVQEVFARAFAEKARTAFDSERPFRPYLLRIARNLLVDHHRRQGREILVEDDSRDSNTGDGLAIAAELPEDEVREWDKRLVATRGYLATLTADLGAFARLRFEEELSQYEIADRLGLSRWKVRSLESRVIKGVERHLKKLKLAP